jgi:hypothetical protein
MVCAAAPTTYSPGTNNVMSIRRYCWRQGRCGRQWAMSWRHRSSMAPRAPTESGQRKIENDIWWHVVCYTAPATRKDSHDVRGYDGIDACVSASGNLFRANDLEARYRRSAAGDGRLGPPANDVAASADFPPIVARGSPAPNRHVVHARATLVTHPRDGAAAGLYMLCHVCGRLRPPQQGARHQGDPGLTWRRSPARQSTPRWRRIGSRTSGGIDLSENRPWQSVKIDASFVRELASRDDAVAIVRAVAGLARSLGITSTAEGVEGTACDSPRGRLR